MKQGRTYEESGARIVEVLVDQLLPALSRASDLYDEDTEEFINEHLEGTARFSISYLILSLFFYIVVIRTLINKFTQQVKKELQFLKVVYVEKGNIKIHIKDG
jgi:hypothetical protein